MIVGVGWHSASYGLFICVFIICLFICVFIICLFVCASAHTWRSKDSLGEVVLFFCQVSLKGQTQVIRLGGRRFHQRSYLTDTS